MLRRDDKGLAEMKDVEKRKRMEVVEEMKDVVG